MEFKVDDKRSCALAGGILCIHLNMWLHNAEPMEDRYKLDENINIEEKINQQSLHTGNELFLIEQLPESRVNLGSYDDPRKHLLFSRHLSN